MLDTTSHIPHKKGSEKSFGVVFSIVFLIVALYPVLISQKFLAYFLDNFKNFDVVELSILAISEGIRLWALVAAVVFSLLAFLAPKVLIAPNKLWSKFGLFFGNIISPIVMMFVFFLTVLPIAVLMRLLGKDLLRQKLDKNSKSYWIKRTEPIGSMKNQF